MQQQPVFISKETLKALAESADAVDFGRSIDTSGGGYMDSAEATARVVATNRTFRRLRPRPERVTFSFGGGGDDGGKEGAQTPPPPSQTATPQPKKRKSLVPAFSAPSSSPTPAAKMIIKPPSRIEIERRNKQIQKAAEGLVSYADVITASAASGENSRQRLKTLKTIFGGKQTGRDGTFLTSSSSSASTKTSSIKAIDSSLEAASSITRRARVKSALSPRKRRNPSAPAATSSSGGALLNMRTIVTTLLKEALSRYVAEDMIPEEQAETWARKYSKNRMIYTMNMRFFAAALVWIYVSFGNKDVEATMKVDEEFGRQVSSSSLTKKIDEIIFIAKPVLTEALSLTSELGGGRGGDSTSSTLTLSSGDRSVLFTYAVWLVYNENQAYSLDSTFYEEGEEEEAVGYEEEEEEA